MKRSKSSEESGGKRRKVARQKAPGIFKEDRVFFIGFGLGKVHRRILEARVLDNGGTVCSTFSAAEVTHIITDLPYDLATKELPQGWMENGTELVSTAWLTECLKLKARLPSHPFEVQRPSRPDPEPEPEEKRSSLRRTRSGGDAGLERRLSRSSSDVTPLARTPSDIAADCVAMDAPPAPHVAKVESNELSTAARLPPMPWLLLPPSDGLKRSSSRTEGDMTDSSSDDESELERSSSWLRYGSQTTSDSEDIVSSESEPEPEDRPHNRLRAVLSGKRPMPARALKEEVKVEDDWLQIPAARPMRRADSGASSSIEVPPILVRAPEVKTKQFPIARNRAQYYACQKKPAALQEASNANTELTDILAQMEKLEKNSGEQWRAMAYRKAIAALKRHPHPIRSGDDARKLKGIGEKIAKKIGEIIETGSLKRLQDASESEFQQTLVLFSDIWGVGGETAKKWYAMGHRTLDDLRKHPTQLNAQQKIGLKHYDSFKQRIPREEVFLLGETVRSALEQVDRNLQMEICGSYRRGASTCGDIDILITNKKGEELDGALESLLTILHREGFLTDDLSRGSPGSSKYMGVCCLPPPTGSGLHRRIDFQTIPLDEWPCALLYFTGSAHLNRSMRLWARKNGFSLSEKALVPRHIAPRGPVNNRRSNPETDELKGDPIPVKTERDIFDALGLEYKAPKERSL